MNITYPPAWLPCAAITPVSEAPDGGIRSAEITKERFLRLGAIDSGQWADWTEELIKVPAVARIAEHAGLVVEREDLKLLRFLPPELLELLELGRLRERQIMHLGEVLGHVVELPHVLVERLRRVGTVVGDEGRAVEDDRLPPVVVERPRSEHLVILGDVTPGNQRIVEGRSETDSLYG